MDLNAGFRIELGMTADGLIDRYPMPNEHSAAIILGSIPILPGLMNFVLQWSFLQDGTIDNPINWCAGVLEVKT